MYLKSNQLSFTLYPAHSRVGRENLVSRHSSSPLSAEFWRHCVLKAELKAALNLDTRERNGNINLSKYFISLSGDLTHNLAFLYSKLKNTHVYTFYR